MCAEETTIGCGYNLAVDLTTRFRSAVGRAEVMMGEHRETIDHLLLGSGKVRA